jgi:hypothetical protein
VCVCGGGGGGTYRAARAAVVQVFHVIGVEHNVVSVTEAQLASRPVPNDPQPRRRVHAHALHHLEGVPGIVCVCARESECEHWSAKTPNGSEFAYTISLRR